MEHTQINIEHLRGAVSAGRTPAQWELDAIAAAIKVVMYDEHFQVALQRYAHGNGSSQAIAQAAVSAVAKHSNLAATVNVLLYDRLAKRARAEAMKGSA